MSSNSTLEYQREYRKRPDRRAAHVRRESERQRRSRARLAQIKLAAGCADCGYREHAEALHFDHLPGHEKLFDLGRCGGKSWTTLQSEMKKCEVVCANCHAVRTAERRSA